MHEEYPKVKSNVSGRYFVDESCIYCELCLELAPKNFSYDSVKGEAFVSAQPNSAEQHTQMKDSIESCPINSIHDSAAQPTSSMVADFGLTQATTPTSLAGSMLQIISRWFSSK